MANLLMPFPRDLAGIPEEIIGLRDPDGQFVARPRRSGLRRLRKADYALGDLVKEGEDIMGFRVSSGRGSSKVTVIDAEGTPRYDGAHDEIVGLYRPYNHWKASDSIDGKLNPAIATQPMIAFRDGDKINVYSADGNIFQDDNQQRALFGGNFEEVYPEDFFVDATTVYFHSRVGDRTSVDDMSQQTFTMQYILGKKNGSWGLYDMKGRCVIAGDKEKLLNIQFASFDRLEKMIFHYIDFDTPPHEAPDFVQVMR